MAIKLPLQRYEVYVNGLVPTDDIGFYVQGDEVANLEAAYKARVKEIESLEARALQLEAERDALNGVLIEIGNMAHDASTGQRCRRQRRGKKYAQIGEICANADR